MRNRKLMRLTRYLPAGLGAGERRRCDWWSLRCRQSAMAERIVTHNTYNNISFKKKKQHGPPSSSDDEKPRVRSSDWWWCDCVCIRLYNIYSLVTWTRYRWRVPRAWLGRNYLYIPKTVSGEPSPLQTGYITALDIIIIIICSRLPR